MLNNKINLKKLSYQKLLKIKSLQQIVDQVKTDILKS